MRSDRDNKGFTLIEVMVAMAVLMIGMLGVMGMQYYAVAGNTSSRELRVATNLSQQIVEQMKSTPYANLASGSDNPVGDATMLGGVAYTRRWWTIPDCVALNLAGDDSSCNAGLAPVCASDPDGGAIVQSTAIKIRTCWTDKNNAIHSATLDTLRWNENVIP